MRKVITGKIYDTTKANEIASWQNHYCRSDFNYTEETLYLTAKGRWFLYGKSNAAGAYAEPIGNTGSGPGVDILALSEANALAWLDKHNKEEALLQYFPGKIEEA